MALLAILMSCNTRNFSVRNKERRIRDEGKGHVSLVDFDILLFKLKRLMNEAELKRTKLYKRNAYIMVIFFKELISSK
jgi:hypothetical protein